MGVVAVTIAPLVACGGREEETNASPADAGVDVPVDRDTGDVPPSDASAEAKLDGFFEASDAPSDTGVSDGSFDTAVPDASVDGSEDSAAPDAQPDVPGSEAGLDGGPPDTGTILTSACGLAGGVLCTPHRWDVCPVGYEPVDDGDGHLECGSGQGWCCQPAPASTCSWAPVTNCIPVKCTGCWQPADDDTLTCEPGRACCQDVCK